MSVDVGGVIRPDLDFMSRSQFKRKTGRVPSNSLKTFSGRLYLALTSGWMITVDGFVCLHVHPEWPLGIRSRFLALDANEDMNHTRFANTLLRPSSSNGHHCVLCVFDPFSLMLPHVAETTSECDLSGWTLVGSFILCRKCFSKFLMFQNWFTKANFSA